MFQFVEKKSKFSSQSIKQNQLQGNKAWQIGPEVVPTRNYRATINVLSTFVDGDQDRLESVEEKNMN